MAKKRVRTIGQIRNLPQYKNKTDEELEEILRVIVEGDTEERVGKVLEDFEKNYDLSDMSANDMLELKNLAQYYIYLDDLNKQIDVHLREKNTIEVDRLIKITERIQKSASEIQTNLAITRKQRKSDKEQDIVSAWEDLKLRAKRFLESRQSYVYCPECRMLLATVWFLYPEEDKNVMRLRCNRVIDVDSGEICGHEFTVSAKELAEGGNRNLEGVLKT